MKYNMMYMKDTAAEINDLTFTDYYYRLSLIAKSVFKWNNLPNGIDEKWIEEMLFENGSCVFFRDETNGFMVLRATESDVNCYDEPINLMPYGTGYDGKKLENNEQCVLIRNNDLRIPTAMSVRLYAYRLADITRTIDVNVNAQKTPVIVVVPSDKQHASFKRAMKKVEKNEPVIYVDKQMDIEGIKTLNMQAPAVFPQLQVQKHAIWNECMSFLGVNNANQEKKERLVESEVSANNEQVEISAAVMLKARERACELINKMFNLNISVEMRIEGLEKFIEDTTEPTGGEE